MPVAMSVVVVVVVVVVAAVGAAAALQTAVYLSFADGGAWRQSFILLAVIAVGIFVVVANARTHPTLRFGDGASSAFGFATWPCVVPQLLLFVLFLPICVTGLAFLVLIQARLRL